MSKSRNGHVPCRYFCNSNVLKGTYYTHEDKNDLVRIVDPYTHEVDICPRVCMVIQNRPRAYNGHLYTRGRSWGGSGEGLGEVESVGVNATRNRGKGAGGDIPQPTLRD